MAFHAPSTFVLLPDPFTPYFQLLVTINRLRLLMLHVECKGHFDKHSACEHVVEMANRKGYLDGGRTFDLLLVVTSV